MDPITDRPAREIILHLEKSDHTIKVASAPYISSDGVVTLFPGDMIIIEFEKIDPSPKNPKVVKENLHPERTLELKMTQDKDMTAVKRTSGFVRKLTMNSYFLILGSDLKNKANMDPLETHLFSFDSFDPKTYCIKFYSFDFAP